ncbi:MAG TPA: hypothetical protein VN181_15565 [Thermoanaerobaculia bacterium]|nr:hypothetical protein [Thermoanaerobaculia bacterium]
MKRISFLPLVLLATFCASGPSTTQTAAPGHGAIVLEITPSPIVAHPVSGAMYEFPFEVIVRETGGAHVTVDKVTVDVFAFDRLRVGGETYDAAQLAQLGYTVSIPAGTERRFKFSPRREVTDDRVFGSLSAQLRVDAHDDTGTATSATTAVSVTRQ